MKFLFLSCALKDIALMGQVWLPCYRRAPPWNQGNTLEWGTNNQMGKQSQNGVFTLKCKHLTFKGTVEETNPSINRHNQL